MLSPVSHADKFKRLGDSAKPCWPSHAGERAVEMQGLLGGHKWWEAVVFGQISDLAKCRLVSNGLAKHGAGQLGRMDDRHQDLDQCRLASAIGAEQAEDLSRIDGHRYASKGMHLPSEGLMDVLDFDCCRHAAVDGNGVSPSATR